MTPATTSSAPKRRRERGASTLGVLALAQWCVWVVGAAAMSASVIYRITREPQVESPASRRSS
jgi:hypothetical protein